MVEVQMDFARGVEVERVTSLPDQFDHLRAEAAAEGIRNMEALFGEWQDGSNRFTRPGELLAVAWADGDLAGIGGITQDVVDPAALRMRRFYVRASYRHRGVGRAIANFVLAAARPLDRQIVLNTDTERGSAFWEALGFRRIVRERATHVLPG
jgi:GNAT superfamily N-acetyltransferase